MATQRQASYIGSLLYHAGMGMAGSGKVHMYCLDNVSDTEASIIISHLKQHGIDDLDMYDSEEEVVPERIRDILKKSFTTV